MDSETGCGTVRDRPDQRRCQRRRGALPDLSVSLPHYLSTESQIQGNGILGVSQSLRFCIPISAGSLAGLSAPQL
jgi:hypothetical protein